MIGWIVEKTISSGTRGIARRLRQVIVRASVIAIRGPDQAPDRNRRRDRRCRHRAATDACSASSGVRFGRLAGELKEHVVEGRFADRPSSPVRARQHRDARTASTHRPAPSRRRGARSIAVDPGRGDRAAGARRGPSTAHRRSKSTSIIVAPIRCLELGGGALGDHRPWSITTMRSASRSASSRYWVVSSTVVPVGDQLLDDAHSRCGCAGRDRSSARRGRGPAAGARARRPGRAGGACRPSRCLTRSVGGVGEIETFEQLVGARRRRRAREVGEAADEPQVLAPGEVLVDGRVLTGEADRRAPAAVRG